MVKYATALRLGTAETESILRRFTRTTIQHPTYQAICELGKAKKTIFLCHYLRDESLRREIQEGLNVIERWNGVNDFIFFGCGGEFMTNDREEREISMLCLHLLQSSLVYINTLMIQEILTAPDRKFSLAGLQGTAHALFTYTSILTAPSGSTCRHALSSRGSFRRAYNIVLDGRKKARCWVWAILVFLFRFIVRVMERSAAAVSYHNNHWSLAPRRDSAYRQICIAKSI